MTVTGPTGSVTSTTQTKCFKILSNGLMNHLTNHRGKALGIQGLLPRTRCVGMGMITGQIEKVWKTRVQSNDTPGLSNRKRGLGKAGLHAVHADTEIRETEAMLTKK